ncbi:MAG: DMT family transporter [Parabacteroides sp.]
MKNKKTEANLSMIVSKTFSGLNANALKYLLPLWIAPLTGVMFRCVFAAIVFWIISIFWKQDKTTRREKITLFLLGAIGLYGFMFFYLLGVSKTTPVSSSLFSSLQPIWVFILSVIFLRERITAMKIIGIAIGLGGALLCILTQKSDDLASDAFTGNMLCLISSIAYAAYLIVSNVVLGKVSSLNMLRYSFLGSSCFLSDRDGFTGFDGHLFIHFEWTPFLVLMFVLIFPTTISYLLIPIGLKYLSTTLVALYGYIILIVATIVSLSIGQDRFSWYQMIAIALICSSVYFVEIAESKDKR